VYYWLITTIIKPTKNDYVMVTCGWDHHARLQAAGACFLQGPTIRASYISTSALLNAHLAVSIKGALMAVFLFKNALE
jgi:hypothetical protein